MGMRIWVPLRRLKGAGAALSLMVVVCSMPPVAALAQDNAARPPQDTAVVVAPATKDPAAPATKDTAVPTTTKVDVTVLKAEGASPVHTDLPSNLSVTGMFKNADPIVKGVMGLLAAASVATWSIFFFKLVELSAARARCRADLRAIARSASLDQVMDAVRKGPVARLAEAAELEVSASQQLAYEGIKERVEIALQRIESSAARKVGVGTGVLASVGSTGPFIGLFGTVWGIMNSFIHISNAHTTNLSVVAPGIAEALLATAMGLVAAIPAVIIYNVFSRWIAAYRQILGDASAGIMRHVSRDLDRTAAGFSSPVPAG